MPSFHIVLIIEFKFSRKILTILDIFHWQETLFPIKHGAHKEEEVYTIQNISEISMTEMRRNQGEIWSEERRQKVAGQHCQQQQQLDEFIVFIERGGGGSNWFATISFGFGLGSSLLLLLLCNPFGGGPWEKLRFPTKWKCRGVNWAWRKINGNEYDSEWATIGGDTLIGKAPAREQI
jgi:hypothetical protein